jgi:hypothetical protein
MRYETIEQLIKDAKPFISSIGEIKLSQWPVAPFEPTDYYINFSMGSNLYACEKICELTPEGFFVFLETLVFHYMYSDYMYSEYIKWKYTILRELKLQELGI